MTYAPEPALSAAEGSRRLCETLILGKECEGARFQPSKTLLLLDAIQRSADVAGDVTCIIAPI